MTKFNQPLKISPPPLLLIWRNIFKLKYDEIIIIALLDYLFCKRLFVQENYLLKTKRQRIKDQGQPEIWHITKIIE